MLFLPCSLFWGVGLLQREQRYIFEGHFRAVFQNTLFFGGKNNRWYRW